jgi:hypothetical protein
MIPREVSDSIDLFKDENWQSCREAHPSNKRVKRTRDTLASGLAFPTFRNIV